MDTPVENILSQWQSYLTNISTNLMELSEQTEFQLIKLKANDTVNGYTGITKARAHKCVETVSILWRYYALLAEVIDKAGKLSSKRGFLGNTENEVKEILDTTLIVIESERIDINERNLLSGENREKKVTPKELLRYMEELFESLGRDIKEIMSAVETVDSRLDNIKKEITRLNSAVKRLGINNIPVFNIEKVTEIERDPLKGAAELDKVVYSMEKYRASLKSAEQDYNIAAETLNKVKGMLSELRELAAKSKISIIESRKIFGERLNFRPVISAEVIESLQDWIEVLESRLSQGYLNAVKVGVLKLELECSMKLETERENFAFNNKAYNEWLDLKGQFKALLAKADVLKAKGKVFDNSRDELVTAIRAGLYAKVVDLEICRQLIRRFELSLKS